MESDLNEENGYGESRLNPHASLGLFYLCGYCKVQVIPQKEDLKVRNKAKKKNYNSSRKTTISIDTSDAPIVSVEINRTNTEAVSQSTTNVTDD